MILHTAVGLELHPLRVSCKTIRPLSLSYVSLTVCSKKTQVYVIIVKCFTTASQNYYKIMCMIISSAAKKKKKKIGCQTVTTVFSYYLTRILGLFESEMFKVSIKSGKRETNTVEATY